MAAGDAQRLLRYWSDGPGLARWAAAGRPYNTLTAELHRAGIPAGSVPALARRIYSEVYGHEPQVTLPRQGADEEETSSALAVALTAGASAATLTSILARAGGVGTAAKRVTDLLNLPELTKPPAAVKLPRGAGARIQVRGTVENVQRRAAYLVKAAKRLAPPLLAGDPDAIDAAKAAEARHYEAHRAATAKRAEAARAAAEKAAAATPSAAGEVMLGWRAKLDERTTADCRAAHGKNFDALHPPSIGLPGAAHVNCRCEAVDAFEGAGRIDDAKLAAAEEGAA